MSKLKIGLLVDSVYCSKYIKDLICLIEKSDSLELKKIIVQDIKVENNLFNKIYKSYKKNGIFYIIGKALFLIVIRLEKYTISKNKFFCNHFKSYDLSQYDLNIYILKPIISKSGFVFKFSDDDISIIESLNLDVLIRCGSGILHGRILRTCKYGIISFHHGDNKKYRGGPAGFWEVLNKNPSTGFVIQRLTTELDGGDILFRGAFPTQSFFTLNQAMLYTKSNIYMKFILENIASKKSLQILDHGTPYDGVLYREPNIYKTLLYFVYLLRLLILKFINRITKRKSIWNVSYIYSEWTKSVLWKGKVIPNPKKHYLADPFVVSRSEGSYLFVEDFDLIKNKGAIRLYKVNNDEVEDLGIIIEEAFHMSFPFIFEYDEEMYMCPETSESEEIRLYKCIDFPKKWIFHSIAIKNINAVDTMIFNKDGYWWLFTNVDTSKVQEFCSELLIFYSHNPLNGNWIPHKKNPVIVNSGIARNGGILVDDKHHYRVAQRQGFLKYGESISVRKIDILSEDKYSESEFCTLNTNFDKSAIGIHHMHSHKDITVYDFCNRV